MGASFDPDRIARLRGRLAKPAAGGVAANSNAARKLLWQRAIVLTLGFTALLYVIEAINFATDNELDNAGVKPRSETGLLGIVFAPVLHANWGHLFGNTLPVIVLGLLTLLTGIGRGLIATAIVWVIAGAGQWLTAPPHSVSVGASVLVFGWLTYLLCWGWFSRNVVQIAVGLAVLVLYGSILWGVLPGNPQISWQGHLFGAIGGVVAGWVLSSHVRRHRRGSDAGRLASQG
ncbi:rhomboid family intramembrane serine protease [Nocardia yunnanensis]|uniref:Rhomboid family intramembrane serine protease n=2 Tax=Nocardia yunnanensis TaxID=2382165 RepID=A0A386ZR32_9NOCA|nr:rhomboid family intramembrane serine protease [Nocardia yunnanensis]